MKSHLALVGSFYGKAEVCESILRVLPQWFGKETALIQYLKDIERLPTLLALIDNECVGFLTFKQHNEYAAELYIMGVRPEYHRQGNSFLSTEVLTTFNAFIYTSILKLIIQPGII